MKDLPLEKRRELAEAGDLEVETHDGKWVDARDTFTCPEVCGNVFSDEEAYREYCPSLCMLREKELKAEVKAVEDQPLYTIYVLYDEKGTVLKVSETLEGPQSAWWWRNVSAIGTRHLSSPEAIQGAIRALQKQLRPVYDVDPHALDHPRPLIDRVVEPKTGPNEIHVAFRVSDELERRINEAAEREGISRAEWLRLATSLLAGGSSASTQDPTEQNDP